MSAQKTTKKKKITAKKTARKTAGKDAPGMDLIDGVLEGNVRAIARMISLAEAAKPENRAALAEVFRHAGNAHVVGMTGVPGSGKSTLVRVLVQAVRATGRRVGVVAIDPSSPFSGGAILGDRVRMAELTIDDGVFIRSMATRGALGGLARSSLEAVDVLDAAGFDMVLIETVGVGQDEVDVVQAAHTVVVVSAPGLGDEIQAIKAGILEIADIHVVSKCDRPDSNATITHLKGMLSLGIRTSGPHDGDWEVSVVPTSAEKGKGIDDLLTAIDAHGRHLKDTGGLDRRRREILEMRVLKTAEDIIRKDFRDKRDKLAPLMKDVEERNMDPHEAAVRLLAAFNGKPEKPGK